MPRSFGATLFAALLLGGCSAIYLVQAERSYDLGHYNTARVYAAEAVRHDPQNVQARTLLARILLRLGADALGRGEVATARRYFEEAKEHDPANADVDGYLEIVRKAERPKDQPRARPRRDRAAPGKPQTPEEAQEEPKDGSSETMRANGLTLKRTAPLYASPSPLATEITTLRAGARVGKIREVGGWYEVETGDGRRGYVASDAVE